MGDGKRKKSANENMVLLLFIFTGEKNLEQWVIMTEDNKQEKDSDTRESQGDWRTMWRDEHWLIGQVKGDM